MEQARPQTSGEEELQLQLALAMSREESEKPPPRVDIDEQTQLQIAMSLSKEEAKKPAPRPPPADIDDDAQLQIALSLSKEVHQQEKRSRQGDESLLQKALEESKREMESKGGTAFMDLVDVFAVPPDVSHSTNPWGDVQPQGAAGLTGRDPWDSLEDSQRGEASWRAPPASSSPAPPWERSQSPADHWDSPRNAADLNTTGRAWTSPAHTDGDLFDEAMDGGQMNVNGRGEGSPELFDLSRLEDSLAAPSPRNCRTPEAFLGPTAASLVNLDALIPANPPAKTLNPFLSSVSSPSPSPSNPFQAEQPKLTLNQMGSSSNSPVPFASSLPYSASLPLPASHQPTSLPTSFTHPSQAGALDIAGALPQPLLPVLSASTLESQSELHSQNPFL
ncbi:Epsin-3 [Merluccius polli]|uniref:Epsin-3 n=1 Tax=Merluccius polli TaxID=89951 RepID=A0AA47MEP9_MERPO|nr:Epsin-3 [Merluccius polli]